METSETVDGSSRASFLLTDQTRPKPDQNPTKTRPNRPKQPFPETLWRPRDRDGGILCTGRTTNGYHSRSQTTTQPITETTFRSQRRHKNDISDDTPFTADDTENHRGRHKKTLCFRKGCLGLRPKHACVAHGCRQWPVLGPQKGTHFGTLSDPPEPPKSPISTHFGTPISQTTTQPITETTHKTHSTTLQTCLRDSLSPIH